MRIGEEIGGFKERTTPYKLFNHGAAKKQPFLSAGKE
jgi:hypothetical protein